MAKRRRGGNNHNNKSNNQPEEASTKAQDRRNWKKGCNVYVGRDSQEIYRPLWDLSSPPNSPHNVTEKEGVNKDDDKFSGVFDAAMQSVKEVTANESEIKTSKGSDNSTLDNQVSEQEAGKSKKKRRRPGKSTLDIPGSESFPSAERKPDSSNRVIDEDKDYRSGCKNKAPDYSKAIALRVSQIESQPTKPKSDMYKKPMMTNNKGCSPSEKEKGNAIYCTVEEKVLLYPFDDNYIAHISDDSYTSCSNEPVIFTTDKATQTDPAPEPANISKSTISKNSTTLNSVPDGSIAAKPTEPSLLLPVCETNPEYVADTTQNKINSFPSLSSPDESLQTITEEFFRNLKILRENFEDDINKCLNNDK